MSKSRNIETFVSGVKDLPTLPSVVLKVNQALMDSSATIDSVSSIVERDPALTAKVLRLANSSYYGFSSSVDTLSRAVTVLGFNTIRSLATTVSVFKIFKREPSGSFDMHGLWLHSLGCAIASKVLVHAMGTALREKAFVCGLIHDIGKVVIAQNLPDETAEVLRRLEDDGSPDMAEVEEEVIGFAHTGVGALIAERWHFPRELSEAIRLHHRSGDDPDEAHPVLTYAVYAGNQIAKERGLGRSQNRKVREVQAWVRERLGVSVEDLPGLLERTEYDFNTVVNSWDLA
ncbi:MAG TPA: HDOD domain-containing protein [Nitrospirae bacterium]|nr:HDOD domain-containing protein [Nitrospirota bacterium]